MYQHRSPENISDHVALIITKILRFFADTFFAKRYGHRAVVLETVAAWNGWRNVDSFDLFKKDAK
jgi:ubiquinol oxidase